MSNHPVWAYLATLGAIVLLSFAGAAVCIFAPTNTEVALARVIGALGFIGASVSGLIGVIGTFRPKGESNIGPNENVTVEEPGGKREGLDL